MQFDRDSAFYKLLDTKGKADQEERAISILQGKKEIATFVWPGPDADGRPFIRGSTALHYAAIDGKERLIYALIDLGADVNASDALWYRSVLSWAANGGHCSTLKLLLASGANPKSFDAMHAAAHGGDTRGKGKEKEYAEALKILVDAGANKNDRMNNFRRSPLSVALMRGNKGAIKYLKSIDAEE